MNEHQPKMRVKQKQVNPIVIKTIADIRSVINRFMPGSDDHVRKLLISGLDEIKNRSKLLEEQNNLDTSEFGVFQPIKIDSTTAHWVDRMIKQLTGGTRDGTNIVWYLNNDKIIFDPYSGVISYDRIDT